jgi:carbamoyltransferase
MEEFYKITGSPLLLNTSLNVGGKPIAGHIDDALELFNSSSMNTLIVGNRIYETT